MASDMTNELSNRDYLILRAYQAGLHEPRELAAFMGQMEVESGGFARMHENLNYSGRRLLQVFPGRNGINTLADANAIASGGPEAVANAMYGGEWGRENLGNTEPGDGWRFHGRGYVQLTGRDNYSRDGRELRLDLVGSPDLAADRANAAAIAIHYWQSRVVQREHQYDVREATHDINGGYNHLPERRAAIARWETMLTPYVMDRLSNGEVALTTTGERDAHREFTRTLQENLNLLGIRDDENTSLTVDGDSGKRTSQALANFQRQHGLTATGAPDALTLSAIESGVRAIKSFEAVEHFGHELLPPGYRTDWLERDANGLPNYLRTSNVPETRIERAVVERTPPSREPAAPALLRSGPSHAAQPTAASPSDEPAVLPALSTTQTLEPGDRSAAVHALQQHLQLLGATDRYGKEIRADKEYGDRTRDAVEQFQLWTGREPTGIADPDTLQALQSQAQFALRQRAQGIAIAPDAHLAEHLRPAMSDLADAAIDRPVQGRGQVGLTPFSDSRHPQHALYADVQQRFQTKGHELSEEHLSALTRQMHFAHYRPGWEGDVTVYQGKAYVGNLLQTSHSASVELNAPTPSVQETMQTFQTGQQNLAEHLDRVNQHQAQAHSHGLSR